jgi:DNA polymerase III epsilon subunit family exonuclease
MWLLERLLSVLAGSDVTSSPHATTNTIQPPNELGIAATFTTRYSPSVEVSDAEVAERVQQHVYVLATAPPLLKVADQWWNQDAHKPRRKAIARGHDWILPFISEEIIKIKQLQVPLEWGPHGANTIAKELRALIRERRKAKQPYLELLQALYGACIAADFLASLKFEGAQPHHVAQFVDINDLRTIKIEFMVMGYKCVESLSKTDVKWLVETFGEPGEHQSLDSLWPQIRQNAVARYCWGELSRSNDAAKSLGLPQKTMQEWLSELAKRNITYFKQWQERVATREDHLAQITTTLDAAWAATRQIFIVADLETTGLNAEIDEVIELAAIKVRPDGGVTDEFSALARISRPLPAEITKLTGITQDVIDHEGRLPADVMKEFTAFIGMHPVFFHNAKFDQKFIEKTAANAKMKFISPVYDTLLLARQAWPSLPTYKLAKLAQHIGVPVPRHRALGDAKAALAVLLAARQKIEPE